MRHRISFLVAAVAAALIVLGPRAAAADAGGGESGAEEDGLFGLTYRESDHPRTGDLRGEPQSAWDGKVTRPRVEWDGRQPQTEVTEDYWPAPKASAKASSSGRNAEQNALVRRTQESLRALGYDPGPVDGMHGQKTVAAILAYQRDRGLPDTGAFSALLVDRMTEEVATRQAAEAAARERPKVADAPMIDPMPEEAAMRGGFAFAPEDVAEPADTLEDGEATGSMPPTMARASETRPLHLAELDLVALALLGDELPPALLEKLVQARWHYEAAAEEPLAGRFFAPGDTKPKDGARDRLLSEFLDWAESRSPTLPLTVAAHEPLSLRAPSDDTSAMMQRAGGQCFEGPPHLLARAQLDAAAEFCRASLNEGTTQSSGGRLAPQASVCRKLIELSAEQRFHQLSGGEACGGYAYMEPRFILDRAYVLRVAGDLESRLARAAQHFHIVGVRYSPTAPARYFEVADLVAETGFDRIVGAVPDSVNPAQHYLIFDVEPLRPELAAVR